MREKITRRRALAGGAAIAGGIVGGCLNPVDRLLGGSTAEQLSVQIATLPADEDEDATKITRQLVDRLEAIGIETEMIPLPPLQLQEEVLLRRNYDMYVAPMAVPHDPNFLRPLLHSRYIELVGWQNPFGFTNATLDEKLDAQRMQTGPDRIRTMNEIQDIVVSEQPYTPLIREQAIAAIGTDRFEGWTKYNSRDPMWLLGLERTDVSPNDDSLTVGTTAIETTETANPLRPRFSEFNPTRSLLYDQLARYFNGEYGSWLAESFTEENGSDYVRVRLRPNLRWHDGRQLTPSDVEFTYRFLADTSLGAAEAPLPAPTYQDRITAVDDIEIVGERTLRIRVDADGNAGMRAFTVPLLPEHIWEERTEVTDPEQGLTEAMTWENPEPIGCGPLAYEDRNRKQWIDMVRFGSHPINRNTQSLLNVQFTPVAFSDIRFQVVSSDANTLDLIEEGLADVTTPDLRSSVVSRIARSDEISLHVTPSRTVYHVGFNERKRPMRNPNFRRAVARVLNKRNIANSIFGGFADPIASPLIDNTWIPESLQWRETDPELPFIGSESELDVEAAREQFVEAGYVYTDDGKLIYA